MPDGPKNQQPMWDPSCNAIKMVIAAPSQGYYTCGSASVSVTFTEPNNTKNIQDYSSPPPNGKIGAFFLTSPQNYAGGTMNYLGPEAGQADMVIYLYPTYGDSKTIYPPPTGSGTSADPYIFVTPQLNGPGDGGQISIVITMVEPGGGGLSL